MNIQRPKGTQDLLPKDSAKRQHIEEKLKKIASIYNYKEIRTPTFENTALFKRSIGEATDVVSKEMYSLKNGEFTLKPEMTAPVIRAYIENSMKNEFPIQKLFYISNMYRHERPQAGRFREFSQFGVEAIGSSDYLVDAELISLGAKMLNEFGIGNIIFKINTIGSIAERARFLDDLKKYLVQYKNKLSETNLLRLETNPLRILDTKIKEEIEILKNSPILYDYLNPETKSHFDNVLNALKSIEIKYEIDYKLVRGFDYYTSTTFEVLSDDLGAQNAIFGGGRYDNLVEQLGGKPTPAIGFACGLERLTMILEKNNYEFPSKEKIEYYFVTIGTDAKFFSLKLMEDLRNKGIICETDFLNRSVKAQMKEANKIGAEYVIVIGDNEIKEKKFKIKNMKDSTEIVTNYNDFIDYAEKILKDK
ncbi:MAG: histidine--tRNA ligase [Ignavibacteriae bacterium]|nr:histidine--tRNA ligase [Ignavibacteriota bacterium]